MGAVAEVLCEGLLFGGDCDVPTSIAVCPECGKALHAENQDFDVESGLPTLGGLDVYCTTDPFGSKHWHWQSEWKPVINAVEKWCGAIAT